MERAVEGNAMTLRTCPNSCPPTVRLNTTGLFPVILHVSESWEQMQPPHVSMFLLSLFLLPSLQIFMR